MANTVYENKVIEAKAKDLLTTALNTRNLMTVDNELAETAGMIKTINVYTYSGTAEELETSIFGDLIDGKAKEDKCQRSGSFPFACTVLCVGNVI